MPRPISGTTVQLRVRRSLRRLLRADRGLLRRDAAERAIQHRLAVYLEQIFPGRDVDVDYNRHGRDPKEIGIPEECRGRARRGRVFPDVIVHQRGNDDYNLLVIEMKKSTNSQSRACDVAKIQAYRRDLRYCYGVFIDLLTGVDNPTIVAVRWFGV